MKDFDIKLAEKYFYGHCTPEEAKKVLEWLNTSEGRSYYGKVMRDRMEQLEERASVLPPADANFDKILDNIYAAEEDRKETPVTTPSRNLRPSYFKPYKIAATLAGLMLVSVAIFTLFFHNQGHLRFATTYGETRQVTLPDGSLVTLNANSNLRFENQEDGRKVWLEGEAFFSVVHTDDDRKFIVHSTDVRVEVLGTEFNVNNHRGKTRVMLNSGKVNLQSLTSDHQIVMEPGELAAFSEERQQFVTQVVNPDLHTSWKHNQLIFQSTPFNEVIQLLEDNHGLKISTENLQTDGLIFTATLPADDVDILLQALSRSFNVEIIKDDNAVIIKNKE